MRRYALIVLTPGLLMVTDPALLADPPKPRVALQGHAERVWSVAFTADGKTLASGGDDETVRLWDVNTGKQRAVLEPHPHWVRSLAITLNGKTLVAGCWDGTVHVWDLASAKKRLTFRAHTNSVGSVALSPDGKTLASGLTHMVKLWDVETGKVKAT